MELEEAEQAAIREGRRIAESSLEMANVGKSWDPVTEWEFRVRCQREGLAYWAEQQGGILTEEDLPLNNYGSGGQEHIVLMILQ